MDKHFNTNRDEQTRLEHDIIKHIEAWHFKTCTDNFISGMHKIKSNQYNTKPGDM